ncbi:MAG: haloalkane dehalogenase [Parvibaculales bacterium]
MKKLALVFMLLVLPLQAISEEVRPGIMRTPDAAFENLKDFDFEPNYMNIQGLRVHYLDEGPEDGQPIFLLHGQPTWGYLFRHMIPPLANAGYRVIVPDMAGFGRSDKPAKKEDYSYPKHIEMMSELVERLELKDAVFFGQDWGGLVGLRVVAEMPDRFSHIVVSNTGLISAEGIRARIGYPLLKLAVWWEGEMTFEEMIERANFRSWIAYAYYDKNLAVGKLMRAMGDIDDEQIIEGYEAPFPSSAYKAGAQVFPYLIPSQLAENAEVWKNIYENWEKPFLVAFTDEDPVSSGTDMADQFETRVPGATREVIEGVGHFVQEEVGPQLAILIDDFVSGRPVSGFKK